ncbi:MAG: glycosyltransferase family 2 protein [Candidatus Delongbacteria bacterium]|nr:glycosyltransferase family 2 protein [Candidatus Delongbacteria bacterium]
MSNNIKISIISPAYKCSECIKELYSRLVLSLEKITDSFEIIFINDGSPDNDWGIIKEVASNDKRVKGINLSRNFGQHYAITAGLDHASGDWIVVMDCDLQDQPEEIEKMFNKAIEGYDVVVGRREDRKDSFLKKMSSKLFYKVYSYFTEIDTDSSIANFGVYSKKVISNYRKMKEQNRNFPFSVKWLGFASTHIDVKHSERYAGKTSYNFNKLLNFAIDSIVSQSNKPLRLSIKFGFILSFLSFTYGLFLIVKYFVTDIGVQGWTSTMVSLFFIAGLLLANMGLLGLYIGKIFDETKNRPLYIIKDLLNYEE